MPYEMLTSQLTCLRLPNRGLVGWSLSVGPLLVAAFSVVSPRPVPTLGLVENDGFVLDVLAKCYWRVKPSLVLPLVRSRVLSSEWMPGER